MEDVVLTWQAWFTLGVLAVMFSVLLFTKANTAMVFIGAMTALYVSGVLKLKEAFGGFCSESVLVVATMFMVIAGLIHTGVLKWVVKHVMGRPKSLNKAIVRVMLPTAVLSSVLSNTTVVALFVNVVKMWSRKLRISPSKLLIPLSYASGMGGICTLIGTPPNLIISGMYAEQTGEHMSIFTPLIPGLFCLTVGILSVLALKKFIPNRKSPMENSSDSEYTIELRVPSNNVNIGKGFAEAISNADADDIGLELLALRHFDNEMICPVQDDTIIMGSDRLMVSGRGEQIKRFCQRMGFVNEHLEGVLNDVSDKKNSWRTAVSSLIMVIAIALSAFNVLTLLQACLLAAGAMLIFKCCTPTQALNSIDLGILVIFAGSAAIGAAIEKTGLAAVVANGILQICGNNPYVVLAGICLVGTFITEFISNTAAGAMFFPIAMSSATALGVSPMTFCVALMISVSSSFATPIGSPTHMLVYSPGGYKFSDFALIGIPMNFIILAANIFITTIVFPF